MFSSKRVCAYTTIFWLGIYLILFSGCVNKRANVFVLDSQINLRTIPKEVEEIEAKFFIVNQGPNILRIESVVPDCFCVVPDLKKEIVNINDTLLISGQL
jgi:hypothetical protein